MTQFIEFFEWFVSINPTSHQTLKLQILKRRKDDVDKK